MRNLSLEAAAEARYVAILSAIQERHRAGLPQPA